MAHRLTALQRKFFAKKGTSKAGGAAKPKKAMPTFLKRKLGK